MLFQNSLLLKYKVTNLNGASMHPTLVEGDRLFLEKISSNSLKLGDLVVFIKRGYAVCHRLVWKKKRKGKLFLWEKGDNALLSNPLAFEQIVGRVKEVYRCGKQVDLSDIRRVYFNIGMALVFRMIQRLRRWVKPIFPGRGRKNTRLVAMLRIIMKYNHAINRLMDFKAPALPQGI
jgi:signal peptidase I